MSPEPTTPLPLSDVPPPPERGGQPYELGSFGMKILLASLSVLFAATIVGYLATRANATQWPPPGTPPLPKGLWLSTGIILVCSVAAQSAVSAARRNRQAAMRRALVATAVLGLAFLVTQGFNWYVLIQRNFTVRSHLMAFLFYFLTGLHAAHVIGGLVPLGIVTAKALKGEYSSVYHPGVRYLALYWHFLDVIWLILFGVLLATA